MLETTNPTQLTRRENWPARLDAELALWWGVSFVWGQSDCLMLCRCCGLALTGCDVLSDLPAYDSEFSAAKELVRMGFTSPAELVSQRLEEISPLAVRRGDWVMRDEEGLVPGAFGVNLGSRSCHMGLEGPALLPAQSATRAWRVA